MLLMHIRPFHSKSDYVVQGYNYKSMNLSKPRTYAKVYINYFICIKFESSSIKNGFCGVKKVQITN